MKTFCLGDGFSASRGIVTCGAAVWRCLFGTALCAFVAGGLPAGELRIMPMGDSITYGSHSAATAGYRGPLYTLLTEAGYTNFKFVGTATDTPGTLPSDQQHHEGHSGWVIQKNNGKGMFEYLPTSFSTILGPHVILLHLGTNDAPTPSTFPDAVKNLYVLVRSQPAGATGDFLVEPEGGVLTQGRRRTLTLTASAPAALSYQWRLNGEAIPFADTAWLDLDWATAKTGVYDVVARLADGTSAVSAGAFARVALPETLILVR